MTREQLLEAAGISETTLHTYLYVDQEGKIIATEKYDRLSVPIDEYESIGYVSHMMKA